MYTYAYERYKIQPTIFNPNLGLTALDVMNFFYYFGYICTTLKKYNEAVQAFRKVLIHPTGIIHKCMVNAYKKYIIVSLLIGKDPNFPKKCNEISIMYLSKLAENYRNLVDAMSIVSFLLKDA